MHQFLPKIPEYISQLLKRLGFVLLLMYITRLVFYFQNASFFKNLDLIDFLLAIWFDAVTMGLLFIPYYTFVLIPHPFKEKLFYRIWLKLLFHLTATLILAFNLMDVAYFQYTSKRSTFDLFTMVSTGNDVNQLLTSFISDFWLLILILIFLVAINEWFYRRTATKEKKSAPFKKQVFYFLALMPIFFIIGRGGFALKPIGIIEAARFSKPQNTAFLLPTAFTLIKTIDQTGLKPIVYFDDLQAKRHFNPIKKSKAADILPEKTNVVIVMLESFGIEFIGSYSGEKGYTPFFDSIIAESLTFEYAFANGKKSIEAVPAVLASIPSLMDNPYISSPYGDNSITALPTLLKKYGYESAFYHGATNGSMRFDGFASIAGFDHYFGRYEYNNDAHFDKTWGILDEYFNPWTAKKISELKQPFFATLFTLSSHHPYYIPNHMLKRVDHGPQKICASISYGDYALKRFFEEARKQKWYENTLFVLLADHTPASTTPEYNTRTHLYRIPIVFYHPSGKLKFREKNRVFQQLDILPTLLDLLNIETKYYAFGNSYYQDKEGEAFVYLEGSYYYFNGSNMFIFRNDQIEQFVAFNRKNVKSETIKLANKKDFTIFEDRIKAIIQIYGRDLTQNQTRIYERAH